MHEGRRRFLLASAVAPLAFAACDAQPPLTRVGGIVWIGYEPLFLARELGLYNPDALRLVEMPSNSVNLMSLATGDVEAATLTLDEFLLAREGGLDVRAILVFDYSAGADVLMSRPGIGGLRDLRGRRVGVEQTAAGALMLAKALEAAGLAPHEVVKVQVTADRHLQAYLAGDVDAVVTWEPHATRLQAHGARRLFDSRAFPGLIVDVLAARADGLARAPESFRELLAGYFRALDYMQRAPADAFSRMAMRAGVSPAELRTAQRGVRFMDLAANREWLNGARARLLPAAANVARVMAAAGLLRRMPSLDGLADPDFLPQPS